jgi:hypothetical protein
MLAAHWIKAAAILLYLLAIAWVLGQCERLLAPAKPPEPDAAAKPANSKPDATPAGTPVSEQAKLRAEKRKAHEDELAKRQAQYLALEADLAGMIQSDIPAALAELAQAAARYKAKISDLKNLKAADRWDRETPVKHAHARARDLTQEWYRIDLEAQKEREGPTLHSAAEIDALTKRIAAFKGGGEEVDAFAGALAPLHGKVPESLLLSAIDAIPRRVLPKDAFDPCRDPAAAGCPKPAPAEASVKHQTFCVSRSASQAELIVFAEPNSSAPVIARLTRGQCGVPLTGHQHVAATPRGWMRWHYVIIDGRKGWVTDGALRSPSPTTPAPRQRYCADAFAIVGPVLTMQERPDYHAPIIAHISPTSCRLTATGREAGNGDWLEVTHPDGPTGWVRAASVYPKN